MTPSPQQANVYNWIKHGAGSGVLVAVAGAGKTTTLIEALKLMSGSIFFGAFNKKICEEIQRRAGNQPGLTISTMHAAGFSAWRRVAKYPTVNADKVRDIFRELTAREPMFVGLLQGSVTQLVSLAKQAGLGIHDFPPIDKPDSWQALIDHYDIETFSEGQGVDQTDLVIKWAERCLHASNQRGQHEVDFDDMVYLPLYRGVSMPKYDWVLIDEAQDTNATRRELALRMMAPTSRLIAVGDPRQAIYQFQGADTGAMSLIAESTNATSLPLTITYRCPKQVVKYAQQWVTHIEAADTAPAGSVRTAAITELVQEVKPGDAVLCRFNAPLVEHAYKLIGAGVAAKIEGREIGNGIKALATRWKVRSFDALEAKLELYVARETAKLAAKQQQHKLQALDDKVRCLQIFIGQARTADPTADPVRAVCARIDAVFGDVSTAPVVLLSSIHKSKGREWEKVVWLQTGAPRRALLPWQVEAEDNLCYVAATRAKRELVLIDISAN
jgi:superfamily I DNA/RNA helicase